MQAVFSHKYTLYGGAMGGGKSYWLRWMLVILLLYWFKELKLEGVEVGLFCEDYPALKDRQISKVGKEFPEWLGTFHSDHKEHGKCYILQECYGGGIIKFRNLDDPSKYASAEFAAIAIDEVTKNTEEVFLGLRTRLRWAGIKDVRMFGATNPGSVGHAWVKRLWIDRDFNEHEEEKDEFIYIPAKVQDNPYLDESYIKSLSGLPEDRRRAYLEGDWDLFKGQYFKEWRRELHVIEPRAIHEYYRKFICLDYGYRAPSAAYWCFKDHDDVLYVYRELYETELTYEKLAHKIVEMTPYNEQIDFIVADPAIWATKGDVDVSGAQTLSDTLKQLTGRLWRLEKGNNNRVQGWNVMREYMQPFVRNGEKLARLQVFSTCQHLTRTLPALVYSKRKVEDCDSDGEDHAPDALRYGIMSGAKASPRLASSGVDSLLSRRPTNKTTASKMYR